MEHPAAYWVEAGLCAVLALALAAPIPAALSRTRWPRTAPAAALALWQGIGLAGGMALLTTELTVAAAGSDQHGHWRAAVPALVRASVFRPADVSVTTGCGLGALVLTAAWLTGVLIRSTQRVLSARRAHRAVLDLLSETAPPPVPSAIRVLRHPDPVAYTVPGLRPRVVLSHGAIDALTPTELGAVLAHEQAHLDQHHDLVVQPFLAWRNSFPFLPTARRSLSTVERLTEYLADDRARAERDALGTALETLGHESAGIADRRARLARSAPTRSVPVTALGALAGVAIALVPPLLLVLVG